MITYTSPITKFDGNSLEDLSLKVAELEALLMTVNDMGAMGYDPASNIVSAAERLAHCLQADLQALIIAKNHQRKAAKPATSLLDTLQSQFDELQTGYLEGQLSAEDFVNSMALLGETVSELQGGEE